ncbi:MAG TPA: pyrroline-5-carboxylate reductase, partial [Candidatus Avoscillospira stercoripullorum]|nr:pyrroline-5-carboxylate reductase [Candidatus Avoscillospira stercoripullorum]
VSMAAGVSMAQIRAMAGGDYPVIRIMPNTPVAVGQGVVLYDQTDNVSVEAKALFLTAMGTAGLLDPLEERLMDAGSAVAGCGPAFADLFLEALADGGVLCGLPRAKAQAYAAQMLLGAAALALETEQHPGQLKDAVCSPGGSTIAGVKTLEQFAFRAAVIDAVEAAFEKTKALGN